MLLLHDNQPTGYDRRGSRNMRLVSAGRGGPTAGSWDQGLSTALHAAYRTTTPQKYAQAAVLAMRVHIAKGNETKILETSLWNVI